MFRVENQMKVELLICSMNRELEFINPKVIRIIFLVSVSYGDEVIH